MVRFFIVVISVWVVIKFFIVLMLVWVVVGFFNAVMIKGRHNDTGTNLFSPPDPDYNAAGMADACSDEGFGAMTLDDKGVMHYFRGEFTWMGFQGPTRRINETWEGLTGPIDAAFRKNNPNQPLEHHRIYLFQGSRVWSYLEGQLVSGYPRPISEEFPGIPDELDAAVECHKGECREDSVIFFKGGRVYIYSFQEVPAVKIRSWAELGNCTAALRWLERHYCFTDVSFKRFNPVTGEMLSPHPLDARDYFLRCPGRGHGHAARQNATRMDIKNRCSGRPFHAFSSDDQSRIYAIRDDVYFRVDSRKDGWHAWPLNHTWRGLQGPVDAAFAYINHMYFIQGSQVTIFLTDQIFIPVIGYPKPIQEEWGIPGLTGMDAAFTCPHSSLLYIIRGDQVTLMDLKTRTQSGLDRSIAHKEVDSAMCTEQGVYLFHGPNYYRYANVEALLSSTQAPTPANTASHFFYC
ncbi:hemopexin [Gastrophryne carolinensis]